MNATITVVCYKSKTLKNGESPIMLRVCKDKKKKYQSLGISVNPKHWNFKKNEPKPKCPNFEQIQKIILDKKLEVQKKMLEIRADQKEYTATTLLIKEKHQSFTINEFYQEIIAQCETENKCGNRLVYLNSYNSLMNFTKNRLDIPFNIIDVPWLERYEAWLRSRGNKENTISLQFRTLRSAYNKAIKEKCAQKSAYPFEEFKVSKFDTSTKKRAIAKTDILKFMDDTEPVSQKRYVQLSKDIFMFSYLCGGINFTDIANLTKANIVNGRLEYIRQKTHKLIKIGIPDEAMRIIKKYEAENTGYLFPILNNKVHKTALQKQNRIHKMRGKVNYNLKVLGKRLGIEISVTTYVARHSFASVLKKSGVNIAIISEALGHSDLATTQIYLDSFDNEQIDNAMKNLL
jgi:site-specific recombinase XerD